MEWTLEIIFVNINVDLSTRIFFIFWNYSSIIFSQIITKKKRLEMSNLHNLRFFLIKLEKDWIHHSNLYFKIINIRIRHRFIKKIF